MSLVRVDGKFRTNVGRPPFFRLASQSLNLLPLGIFSSMNASSLFVARLINTPDIISPIGIVLVDNFLILSLA